MRRSKNLSKKRKILISILSVLIVSIISIGGYLFYIVNKSTETLYNKTYEPINTKKAEPEIIEATKPMNILLLGVDTGNEERPDKWEGNSDSMILVTINPKTKKTTLTSLERDIYMNFGDFNAKLNSAYARGQNKEAISTIEKLLNIKIDNYLMINMDGLSDLVDKVGGIEVTNTFDFPISISDQETDNLNQIPPGTHKINGAQALVYSRMRYQDPEGDYGRQKRQREVITKIIQKVLSFDSLSHYQDIINAISNNMKTSIPLNMNNSLALLGYKSSLNTITQEQLTGEDLMLNGISYQIVNGQHLLEIQNKIRKELELPELTELKTNAITVESLNSGIRNEEPDLENQQIQDTTPKEQKEIKQHENKQFNSELGYYE